MKTINVITNASKWPLRVRACCGFNMRIIEVSCPEMRRNAKANKQKWLEIFKRLTIMIMGVKLDAHTHNTAKQIISLCTYVHHEWKRG